MRAHFLQHVSFEGPDSLAGLVTHCRAELQPSAYVQPEAALLASPLEKYRTINRLMAEVLSFLLNGTVSI